MNEKKIIKKLQEHPEGEAEIKNTSDPDIDGMDGQDAFMLQTKFSFFILKTHISAHNSAQKRPNFFSMESKIKTNFR